MSIENLILAEGDEARKNNEKKTSNRKVRFLKSGQSVKARFITSKFVQYAQHGDFEKKIQSHACLDPKGKTNCPSCKVGVKRAVKTLVFLYDVENGEIVVRDLAKSSMAPIYEFTDSYGDKDNEFAVRSTPVKVTLGEKGAITVMPLAPKDAKGVAEIPDDVVIDEDLLAYVMGVRTPDEITQLIAGKTSSNDAGDVKIEKSGPAPGPKNENGEEAF
jgi:hypothetical protein